MGLDWTRIAEMATDNIARTTLTWAPEGKRRRGRPRMTRRRSAEREREEMGWQSWRAATTSAKDLEGWKAFLYSFKCPPRHEDN